jgi:DNA-binding MarR family transcriptional regulator
MSGDTIRDDLAYIYKKLDSLQEDRFKEKAGIADKNIHISTPDDITKAKNRLVKRDLLTEMLQSDCEKLGYIEERINKMLFYLAGTSRLTGEPLSVLDISPPGTGKSYGMSTVMSLMPPDEVLKYSRLTPNALYYKSENDLQGRVLFIEEIVGMENSLEALRMLISSGELAVSGVEKDARTGQLHTVERRVTANIPVISTGVRDIFDEETLSRFILTYNETTEEHLKRIMKAQGHRYSLDGEKLKTRQDRLRENHWHIQRAFDTNLKIINPFHEKIQVNVKLPIASRKNMQYLRLMHNIAFIRQHSREVKKDIDRNGNTICYIEVTADDVALANEIVSYAFRYLGSDLTKRQHEAYSAILRHCEEMITKKRIGLYEYKFSRREIRESCGWDAMTAKRLFDELERLEYIRKINGSGQGMRYLYQLITIGERKTFDPMLNFIDPAKL